MTPGGAMLPKRVNSLGRVYITSQELPAGPYRGVIFTFEWHRKIIVAVVVVVIGFRVKITEKQVENLVTMSLSCLLHRLYSLRCVTELEIFVMIFICDVVISVTSL
jgi:hypothetical protein